MGNYIASPSLSFGQAVKNCFKKYACFTGRSRRSEYWWFQIITWIVSCACSMVLNWKLSVRAEVDELGNQMGAALFDEEKMAAFKQQMELLEQKADSVDTLFPIFMIIIGVIALLLLLPSIGVAVRRLHDIGKSGWWLLLCLIPIVNCVFVIVMIVWTVKDSDKEANKYGESPKYILEP